MRLTAHALLFSCLCASVVVADDYEIILDSYNELELVAGLGQQEDVNGWLPAIEGANALQVELSNTHMTMADAAGLAVIGAEPPAFGAEPADVIMAIAPASEFPIQDAGQPILVHHVVTGAEVAVAKDQFAPGRGVPFQPPQAPLEDGMGGGKAIQVMAQPIDRMQRRARLRHT